MDYRSVPVPLSTAVVSVRHDQQQTVYASTSGRRMDAAKGPRERLVYPAICWAADDYAEVRTIFKIVICFIVQFCFNAIPVTTDIFFVEHTRQCILSVQNVMENILPSPCGLCTLIVRNRQNCRVPPAVGCSIRFQFSRRFCIFTVYLSIL